MSTTIKGDLRSQWAALSVITTAGATVDIDRSNQGTETPRVVIERIEYRNFPTLSGVDDSLIFETFQVDCYGNTSNEAELISDAISEDIEAMSGSVGASRAVKGTEIQSKTDAYTADEMGGDAGESLVSITCEIQHVPQ